MRPSEDLTQEVLLRGKPLAKDVSVDVAGRHSQYNLFGGTNTWKAGLTGRRPMRL